MGIVRTLVVGGVVAAALPALAQSVSLRPGKYAATLETEMPGGKKMPPMKREECFTPANLKDFSKTLPSKEMMEDCEVSDYKADASKITFNAQCNVGGVTATMSVEVTFTADSYNGVVKAKNPAIGDITMKIAGKRVGDCTK